MRAAVERHDARLVDHLVDDRDVARRLHDLVAVVVDDRQDRAREAARDAAVVDCCGRCTNRPGRGSGGARAARLDAVCAAAVNARHAAVRRIDDQRRLALRLAALEPVRRRRDGARRRRRPACSRRSRARSRRCPALPAATARRLALRELFVGEHVAEPKLLVALHRHADHLGAGPLALQIGIAPRRARDGVRAGCGGCACAASPRRTERQPCATRACLHRHASAAATGRRVDDPRVELHTSAIGASTGIRRAARSRGSSGSPRLDAQHRAFVLVGDHVEQAVGALLHVANALPQIDEQRLAAQLLHLLVEQDAVELARCPGSRPCAGRRRTRRPSTSAACRPCRT